MMARSSRGLYGLVRSRRHPRPSPADRRRACSTATSSARTTSAPRCRRPACTWTRCRHPEGGRTLMMNWIRRVLGESKGVADATPYLTARSGWLRGLDLNQRPLGYEMNQPSQNHGNLQAPDVQIVQSRGRKRNPRATRRVRCCSQPAPNFSGREGPRAHRCYGQRLLHTQVLAFSSPG